MSVLQLDQYQQPWPQWLGVWRTEVLVRPWSIHHKGCPSPATLSKRYSDLKWRQSVYLGGLVTVGGNKQPHCWQIAPKQDNFCQRLCCCLQSGDEGNCEAPAATNWQRRMLKLKVPAPPLQVPLHPPPWRSARAIWKLCNNHCGSEATWWASVAHCFWNYVLLL